jgi:ribA/ribD-fused uncharacterized protein
MMHDFTFFYSSLHPFSNWYMMPFVHRGKQYNCGEQYMMYQKAILFKDYDVAEMILEQSNPRNQKFLGREVRGFVEGAWNAVCRPLMVEGLTSKFRQDTYCLNTLLDTGDTVIVEASPTDRIWGVGLAANDPLILDPKNWRGTNWLGQVLMEVRNVVKSGV